MAAGIGLTGQELFPRFSDAEYARRYQQGLQLTYSTDGEPTISLATQKKVWILYGV